MREIYELDDELVIVATDRVSTYDVILPTRIPDKGRVLTNLSTYWFRGLEAIVPHHFVTSTPSELPEPFRAVAELAGRTMLVRKAKRFDVECIVRGYLAGSGLREYDQRGTVCGVELPQGIEPYGPLPEAIFTPTTKADDGHDLPITYEDMVDMIGREAATTLREMSLTIYSHAAAHALDRGVIIADTKFEFGLRDGEIIVIDEVLTPDSSRFWDRERYEPGREPEPMDKQYVRNAVDALGWDHSPPAPALPETVVEETRRRYETAVTRITHDEASPRWEGSGK